MFTYIRQKSAFSLIEIMLVVVIVAVVSGSFMSLLFTTQFGTLLKLDQEQALFYAQEGMEVVRNIKYDNFLYLGEGDFQLQRSGNTYSLVSGPGESLNGIYTRSVTIEPVYRNNANEIDEDGETEDQQSKKITVTLSWESNGTEKSMILEEIFTDWQGISWQQTTLAQFAAGSVNNVTVSASDDDVIDDNGKIELSSVSIPGSLLASENVQQQAADVKAVGENVYLAVQKGSGGFCQVDISDPSTPTLTACINVNDKGNALDAAGDYAYVGVEDRNQGLAIVQLCG